MLKITPRRYQDSVLWEWLEFVSPLRCTNSKQSCHIQFGLLYPKRYRKGFRCGSFVAEHSKAYQSCFFAPLKICTMSSPVLFVPLLGRMQQMWGAAVATTLLGLHVHRGLITRTLWEYSQPSYMCVSISWLYKTSCECICDWLPLALTRQYKRDAAMIFSAISWGSLPYWFTFYMTFPVITTKIQ